MSRDSIWSIDRTQSNAATLGQLRPGSNGNEGVIHILLNSKTGVSTSDCLISYPGLSLGSLTLLKRCSQCILLSQTTGPQDTRWRCLTPVQRYSRWILLGHRTLVGEVLTRSEMHSVNYTAPDDWADKIVHSSISKSSKLAQKEYKRQGGSKWSETFVGLIEAN